MIFRYFKVYVYDLPKKIPADAKLYIRTIYGEGVNRDLKWVEETSYQGFFKHKEGSLNDGFREVLTGGVDCWEYKNLESSKYDIARIIKDTHNQLIEKWGPYMEVNDPSLYESMTGKKAREPIIEVSDLNEEVKKIDTSYDDLYAYQKKREAEREAQLEKEREKLKKKEIKFNFTTPKKDWSIYGGWVNPFEPINKGRLGSTQEWRVEKPKKHYY